MKKLFTLLILLCAVVAAQAGTKKVYVQCSSSTSSSLNVYAWQNSSSSNNNSWPGVGMTKKYDASGNQWFVADIDENYDRIIFNNGNGSQTADLTISTGTTTIGYKLEAWGNCYTINLPSTVTLYDTAPSGYVWFIPGEFNGWTNLNPLTETSPGSGIYTITTAGLNNGFKIYKNDGTWYGYVKHSSAERARMEDINIAHNTLTLSTNSENLYFKENIQYDLTLDTTGDSPTLTVVPHDGWRLYLKGDFNDWGAYLELTEDEDGIFRYEGFEITSDKQFAFADNLNPIQWIASTNTGEWYELHRGWCYNIDLGSGPTQQAFSFSHDGTWTIEYNPSTKKISAKQTNETYSVLGDKAIFGGESDFSVDFNLSSTATNYVYYGTLNKVLAAGTYEYKARTNGAYDLYNIPSDGNNSINISTGGNYKLEFWLNLSANSLNCDATAIPAPELSLDYLYALYANARYNDQTHTMTTTGEWDGVHIYLGASSTLSGDYLVVKKTQTDQRLYVYVEDTDGNQIADKTFDAATTTCILPLDNTKNIKEIQLKNPAAGSITLTKLIVTNNIAKPLASAAGGYATFSSTYDVAIPDGITAKYATGVTNGAIDWSDPLTNGIPANTGVLLIGTAGEEYTFTPATSDVVAPRTNYLKAISTKTKVAQTEGGATRYILARPADNPTSGTIAFYKVNGNGSWCAAGTAYLEVPGVTTAPAFISLDGETTAIDAIDFDEQTSKEANATIFDLSGRKVNANNLPKGIYVKNGKKFIVK